MPRQILSIVVLFLQLLWLSAASAQTRAFTDGAGRTVEVPERIERVMAAGENGGGKLDHGSGGIVLLRAA